MATLASVPIHVPEVFVDTSAFFAVVNRPETNHAQAVRILTQLEQDQAFLITTTYIIAEAHALILTKLGRDFGVRFLRASENCTRTIVWPTVEDEQTAREIIYRYTDKDFSLTDAISFAVMQRLGASVAFTFDRDFERFGFTALRA